MTAFLRKIYTSILNHETRLWLYKLRHQDEYKKLRRQIYPSAKGDFSLRGFDEHQCIFVHITKTAGTSIAKSLFNYLPYHYTAIDYRVIYGRRNFNAYFKFAFVRNPWDRVYSAYRYLKSGGWNEEDKKWFELNISKYSDFDDFVKNWLTTNNIKKHLHFMPQHHFICDTNDQILVNFLAYFETINDDFEKITEQLDIDAEISHHNANPASSYLNVYNDETRNIVANIYSKDITIFGYDFNGIKQRRILEP